MKKAALFFMAELTPDNDVVQIYTSLGSMQIFNRIMKGGDYINWMSPKPEPGNRVGLIKVSLPFEVVTIPTT